MHPARPCGGFFYGSPHVEVPGKARHRCCEERSRARRQGQGVRGVVRARRREGVKQGRQLGDEGARRAPLGGAGSAFGSCQTGIRNRNCMEVHLHDLPTPEESLDYSYGNLAVRFRSYSLVGRYREWGGCRAYEP